MHKNGNVCLIALGPSNERRKKVTEELIKKNDYYSNEYWLSTIRKVQAHDAVMGFQNSSVGSKVSGGARVRLHIDTPQSWVQVKSLQGPFLAQQLNLVDHFCSTIVSEGVQKKKKKRRIIRP